MSQEAQKAAEAAVAEVAGAQHEATGVMNEAKTAIADANASTAEATEAMGDANAAKDAAAEALKEVATEANSIKSLKDDMDNWGDTTERIKHLLYFLTNQSVVNTKREAIMSNMTQGLNKTVS